MSTQETEIRARIEAHKTGKQNEEADILGRLESFIGQKSIAPSMVGEIPEPDVGAGLAFRAGTKEGFFMPLTIFGREREELTLDETSEKVAGFLGEMVGLGIGFIPFSTGVGITLRGVGLAAKVSKPVEEFLKFSLAGTLQAAGTAEDLEDVPKQAAIGFAAGVAIDGFFLARAMRGRATAGVPKQADELLSSQTLRSEIELAPQELGKSPERMGVEVRGLADETKNLDQILLDLAEEHVETIRYTGLRDPAPLIGTARANLPDAQVEVRRVVGGKDPSYEVLVHNPADEAGRLTDRQLSQWKSIGSFEDMGVVYRSNMYRATGEPVGPGRIQIRSLDGKVTFAALKSEVTNFLTPKVLSDVSRQAGRMRNALSGTTDIGFTVASRGARGAAAIRRGSVNTSEFQTVKSMREFIEQNLGEISRFEAPSIEDAARQYALTRGIRGLREVEDGITKRVHVFDQQTVSYVPEPPRVGVTLDQGAVETLENGTRVLRSFVPGWENAIVGPLRQQGFAEKEIRNFLEKYTADEARRLERMMDSDLQAIAESSRLKFYGGCE